MAFDSEIALLGTGIAPLIAAKLLVEEGRSVLLLNPDFDFFREDSELPLDPLWPLLGAKDKGPRLARSSPEAALAELRPDFPGAVELWPAAGGTEPGFRDPHAPHVRARSRLWVQSSEGSRDPELQAKLWGALEELYLEASDSGLNPQVIEGLVALRKFPGFSVRTAPGQAAPAADERVQKYRGVVIAKAAEVDVARYRNGVLEFVRERLGAGRIVNAVSQIELTPDGLRFHAEGKPHTARLNRGMMVFWTPRLTAWVLTQARKAGATPWYPRGIRLWEEWRLTSRDSLETDMIGAFDDMIAWAHVEGGSSASNLLSVLRPGPLMAFDPIRMTSVSEWEHVWASAESFQSLSRLCHDFLRWDKFSIRAMRPRAIFEWEREGSWPITEGPVPVHVVCPCDGPLVEVLRSARAACARWLEASS
jgi:hypothetical protein